ncbi:MAG TPA: NAD(P)/FAD-dependent oxidoreductase [Rubricoccaceae bacterium]|jgi:thioredoxin reductase
MTADPTTTDVLVVGAGPAGLTAALVLARAGRSVVVLDGGAGRNAPSAHAHNVFTRDGTAPSELRRVGREQAEGYGARFLDVEATGAEADATGVRVRLADGTELSARRLLLATGVVDELPDIPGLEEAWGQTVVHCPYCHGFELRGRPTVVLGRGGAGAEFAGLITGWTDHVTLLTDGPADLAEDHRAALAELGVDVHEGRVGRLDVDGRDLRAVLFAGGERMSATALYVRPPQHVRGPLVAALGLALTEDGLVRTTEPGQTSVPVVWACGDMVSPRQAVAMAAGSGMGVAAMLNHDLVASGYGFMTAR